MKIFVLLLSWIVDAILFYASLYALSLGVTLLAAFAPALTRPPNFLVLLGTLPLTLLGLLALAAFAVVPAVVAWLTGALSGRRMHPEDAAFKRLQYAGMAGLAIERGAVLWLSLFVLHGWYGPATRNAAAPGVFAALVLFGSLAAILAFRRGWSVSVRKSGKART